MYRVLHVQEEHQVSILSSCCQHAEQADELGDHVSATVVCGLSIGRWEPHAYIVSVA